MEHPFYKKVSWQINQDKCILSFPSWCFTWPSCELLVGNLDVSVKEIIYVTAVQDGQRQWGLLFICGPSRKSGGHKALPGNWVFPPVTWCDPVGACRVNVQPGAGDKDTDVGKTPTLCLSEATRFWGETGMQTYYFSPVSWVLWWCGCIPRLCDVKDLKGMCTCTTNNKTTTNSKQTTKYRNLNVGCGVPCWLSGIRVHLPMQETQVWSLVWEDPTCGATKPMHHDYWACALEPGSCSCWSLPTRACAP